MAQLFALDGNKKLVLAKRAEEGKNYFCRECGGVLRVRGGMHKQRHFFHLRLSPSCRESQKSLEHLQVQYALLNLLPQGECELERQYPEVGRIADTVWEPMKLIFEVQCSPISKEEVEARNRDYGNLGYRVVWLLHEKTFNRWRVTSAENFLPGSHRYYTDMDKSGNGRFFDQIEGFRGGVRKIFRKLPGVVLNQPIINGSQLYFAGDLTDHKNRGEKGIGALIQKALEFEGMSYGGKAAPFLFFLKEWGYFLLVRPYLLLFQMLLERACK